jgi:hypothetical protein
MKPRRGSFVSSCVLALASLAPIARAGQSALGGGSEDIRDIRGPLALPHWELWAMLAAGAVLVVALGGVLFTWLRRRRDRALTAEQRALAQLELARAYAEAGQPREYAMAASDALRGYIEERFALRAAHSTTEEFLDDVATSPSLADRRVALTEFLAACDLAKFGRYQLPFESMSSLQDLARQFISNAGSKPSAQPSSGRAS